MLMTPTPKPARMAPRSQSPLAKNRIAAGIHTTHAPNGSRQKKNMTTPQKTGA